MWSTMTITSLIKKIKMMKTTNLKSEKNKKKTKHDIIMFTQRKNETRISTITHVDEWSGRNDERTYNESKKSFKKSQVFVWDC